MAKQCTYCGQELLKDDAQFCTRCGMLVDSLPITPKKGRLEKPLPSPPIANEGHALREQIAQQPMSKPSSLPPEHPGWMNTLGRDSSPSALSGPPSQPFPPKEQASTEERQKPVRNFRPRSQIRRPIEPAILQGLPPEKNNLSTRPAEPTSESITLLPQLPSTVPPSRELRIKVWDQQQDDSITQLQPEPSASAFEQKGSAASMPLIDVANEGASEAAIEDLPTHLLPVSGQPSLPKAMPQKSVSPRSEPGNLTIEELSNNTIPLTPAQRDVLGDRSSGSPSPRNIDEIARLDTTVVPASLVSKPASLSGLQNPPALASKPRLQTSTPPTSLPGFQSQIARKRSRKPLISVLLLGLCLLLLAAGVWTYTTRPFSVAPVTQPWQEFRSTDLGITMQYPTGWSISAPGKGSISLHDSSNTAMFTVSVDANSNDPAHALQQQVNKLNVTNIKTLDPLIFASIHWQHEQGSVQIKGASYTIILLAAAHGRSLYTLEQIAAQNVFTDYEQTIFGPMRTSVHLL